MRKFAFISILALTLISLRASAQEVSTAHSEDIAEFDRMLEQGKAGHGAAASDAAKMKPAVKDARGEYNEPPPSAIPSGNPKESKHQPAPPALPPPVAPPRPPDLPTGGNGRGNGGSGGAPAPGGGSGTGGPGHAPK